jgi:hypothetical protein
MVYVAYGGTVELYSDYHSAKRLSSEGRAAVAKVLSAKRQEVSNFSRDSPAYDICYYYELEYDGHRGSYGHIGDAPRYHVGQSIPLVYLESEPGVFRLGEIGDSAWKLRGGWRFLVLCAFAAFWDLMVVACLVWGLATAFSYLRQIVIKDRPRDAKPLAKN